MDCKWRWCDGKQCVFENGRFFTSDVIQRIQKNRFFPNDVTQDTDARKKYSLRTLLAGKLFLQIIWHNTQKEPYLWETIHSPFLQPTRSKCIWLSVINPSFVHLYICGDLESIVLTIPTWKKIEKRLIRICESNFLVTTQRRRVLLNNSYFAVGITEKNHRIMGYYVKWARWCG